VGHIARIGEINAYKSLVGISEGESTREYLSVDGKIILKWMLGK